MVTIFACLCRDYFQNYTQEVVTLKADFSLCAHLLYFLDFELGKFIMCSKINKRKIIKRKNCG